MKITFFSAHAAIWVHSLPENRLVRELVHAGHDVTYLSCGKAFTDHCVSMAAYGYDVTMPEIEKNVVCRICQENANILSSASGAAHYRLSSLQSEDDEATIAAFMRALPRDGYLDVTWKGHPIGRIAAYELFLKYKKMSLVLNDEELTYYTIYIRNALRAAICFERFLNKTRPEVMFCYSPQYAVNGICASIAERSGIRVYFIEGSSSNSERYQALRVWDWAIYGLTNPALRRWEDARLRVSPGDVTRVSGHFDELFAGKSFAVYSTPRSAEFSLRHHFDIPAKSQIILATLSSYDEVYAAVIIEKFPDRKLESVVFKNQFEWIRDTIDYVADRPDLFLIIRVHPRDFANKREGIQSEQADHWRDMFRKLPPNVSINWPQDAISLYNMLPEVDLVVTGWSATGVEALAFGIPVVTYDRELPSYPSEIHFTGLSRDAYHDNIEAALRSGRRSEHVMAAIHWLAVSFSLGTVRVAEPHWSDRLYRRLSAWPRLSLDRKARLEKAWKRIQAGRRMSNRSDARVLRRLVATGAPDLITVAAPERKRVDIEGIYKMIAERWSGMARDEQSR